jgi:hypothetical protein
MRWGPEPSVGGPRQEIVGRESLKPVVKCVLHLLLLAVSKLYNLSASKRRVDDEELERFR